jgi:hypothetical protein
MEKVRKHLGMLGFKVEDKVTQFKGVVDSMSFDLYGCVQAGVNPGLDKEGIPKDCRWFDVARLKITSKTPVMEVPNYDYGIVADGKRGPASKPMMHKH